MNWYTQHLPFPYRGWKYVQYLLQRFSLTEKTYTKQLFNGLKLHVNARDHIQKSIFWYGHYEKEVSLLWQSLIREDSCVIDIGANIGYFSLLAAAKARKGKVYSFEPVSRFRTCFQKNMQLNGIRNVELLPYCSSDKNGMIDIYVAGEDNLGMTSLQPPENYSGYKEQARAVVFDDWLLQQKLSTMDVVKIDVEGAEKKVLDGMAMALKSFQPVVFIEIIEAQLQKFGSSARDIYNTLYQYDYVAYEILGRNTVRKTTSDKEGYDILFLPTAYLLPSSINVTR